MYISAVFSFACIACASCNLPDYAHGAAAADPRPSERLSGGAWGVPLRRRDEDTASHELELLSSQKYGEAVVYRS